jgi:methylglutamate dehydrogenase subunit A
MFAHSGPYSGVRLLIEGLKRRAGWREAWRKASLKSAYDVVIVGAGGQGLATAYHLAKDFGPLSIAVIDKGPLGLGNVGRNTTIIRSNYSTPEGIRFHEASLRLWERLEKELNFNVMVSQRGALNLVHSEAQKDQFARQANLMRLEGADREYLNRAEVEAFCPLIDTRNGRFPVIGGFLQRKAGTARHDAVAWGYARAASELGVDIIEHCEVTGIMTDRGKLTGVSTAQGVAKAKKVVFAVAGHSSRLASLAGFRLPIESHALQAFVTESVKPLLDCVVTYGAGHFYVSQSDKGGLVFGGGTDGCNSYAQRGRFAVAEEVLAAGVTLMPSLSRLRVLRQWAGVMDMTMDNAPIISASPVDNLYLNAGWCYGGFKAIPIGGVTTAHLVATGQPHPLAAHLRLSRFAEGRTIDERGTGPYPWMH